MPVGLLITGIPATGKTTLGNYLQRNHHFKHVNLEDDATRNQFLSDPDGFIKGLAVLSRGVVITWGFPPVSEMIEAVLYVRQRGFKLIWLDGDRAAARRKFAQRARENSTAPQQIGLFDLQIRSIDDSQVIRRIKPIEVNPFDKGGELKSVQWLAGEIQRV